MYPCSYTERLTLALIFVLSEATSFTLTSASSNADTSSLITASIAYDHTTSNRKPSAREAGPTNAKTHLIVYDGRLGQLPERVVEALTELSQYHLGCCLVGGLRDGVVVNRGINSGERLHGDQMKRDAARLLSAACSIVATPIHSSSTVSPGSPPPSP